MLVEVAEFDGTVSKNSDSELKTFFSAYEDEFRRPYGVDNVTYPRRTIFFGSVNPPEFLKDITGNSRYWCFNVKTLNCNHNIDMYQLWTEIKYIYDTKYPQWWLTKEESALLEKSNILFETASSIQELILHHFNPDAPEKEERYNATEVIRIINKAEDIVVIQPTKAKEVGGVLTKLFETKFIKGTKKYAMPEPRTKFPPNK